MFTASQLLRHKGEEVHTIAPGASVLDAARKMNDHRIGALVVVDQGQVEGILTERDIMTRVVAEQRAPSLTRVATVMTSQLITATPETSLDHLREIMRDRRIRHVPILDGHRLAGLISIGDLNAAETDDLSSRVQALEEYIAHG